jgi:hypothetical protein
MNLPRVFVAVTIRSATLAHQSENGVYRVDDANRKLVVTAVGPRGPAGVYAEALKRIT